MSVYDQYKKSDPHLRRVALGVVIAMALLLVGLWYVQVVSSRHFVKNLKSQTFRSVRIPAIRGKILDRNGIALADNRPAFNISLYLEELREPFKAESRRLKPNRQVSGTEI